LSGTGVSFGDESWTSWVPTAWICSVNLAQIDVSSGAIGWSMDIASVGLMKGEPLYSLLEDEAKFRAGTDKNAELTSLYRG